MLRPFLKQGRNSASFAKNYKEIVLTEKTMVCFNGNVLFYGKFQILVLF